MRAIDIQLRPRKKDVDGNWSLVFNLKFEHYVMGLNLIFGRIDGPDVYQEEIVYFKPLFGYSADFIVIITNFYVSK